MPGCGTSQNGTPVTSTDLNDSSQNRITYTETIADGRSAIQSMLADSKAPSATVALVDGDGIVWSEAFGYIDKASKTAPTTDTMFAIGSTSKVFAGMAVMKLVDQGMIELDAPLTEYLQGFYMASPEYRQVTVRMLINHTAGFPGGDYQNDVTFEPFPDFATQVFNNLVTQRLKYTPGRMAIYSNDGFTMVDPLVAAVSGKSYTQFVQDEILTPLGMSHSRFCTGPFPAGSYAPRFSGDTVEPQVYTNTFPAGGLYSTPSDMTHVATMLMNGGLYNGVRVLSEASVAEMGRDQTLTLPVNPVPTESYGLGWDWVSYPGLSAVGVRGWAKPGGTVGYSTEFLLAPDDKLAVCITGVSLGFNSILMAERIMLHALVEKGRISKMPEPLPDVVQPEKPATSADLAAITGCYADSFGLTLVEAQSDSTLKVTKYSNGAWNDITSALKLRVDGTFSSDAHPNVSYRTLSADGYTYLARKEPSGMGQFLLESMVGQRFAAGQPVSSAWRARMGKHWLVVNEDASSIHLVDDTPRCTLEALDALPGYIFVTPLIRYSQIVDPSGSDTLAKMCLVLPMAGRDLDDVVIETRNGEEWVRYGSALFRPQATVPVLSSGANTVTIGSEGLAEWRVMPSAGTVSISGGTAWKMYDADFKKMTASGTGGTATSTSAGSYLLLYGAPNVVITLKQGAAQ